MYETQQYQGVNHKMSNDSSNVSTLKSSRIKSPYYHHEDPKKLNYYARFSPNRKKMEIQFEIDIQEGASPLSPRSQKSSSTSKRSASSVKRKIFKDETGEQDGNKFQLVNEQVLLSMTQHHQNRGQIYIDEEQSNQDVNEYNNPLIFDNAKNFSLANATNINFRPIDNQRDQINLIKEQRKQSSDSQESSSFQKMIQLSSSEDNDTYYPSTSFLKNAGGQMLIQDDDSEVQSEKGQIHICQHKNAGEILIQEDDGQNPTEIPRTHLYFQQSIQKNNNTFQQQKKRQIHSQNVSFSIDSDLSMIEQKWNSYFQTENEQQRKPQQQQSHPKENFIFEQKKHEFNDRKMSSSSDEQLPSFSTPDTSLFKIEPQESQRSSSFSQQIKKLNFSDDAFNNQTKQFKRQYTFGNQLHAVFIQQNQTPSQLTEFTQNKTEPLFKKLLPKSVLETFKQDKKNKKNKNLTVKRNQKAQQSQKLNQTNKIQSNANILKSGTINISKANTKQTTPKISQNQKIKAKNQASKSKKDASSNQQLNNQSIEHVSINSYMKKSDYIYTRVHNQQENTINPVEQNEFLQQTQQQSIILINQTQQEFDKTVKRIQLTQEIRQKNQIRQQKLQQQSQKQQHYQNQNDRKSLSNHQITLKTQKSQEYNSYFKIYTQKKPYRGSRTIHHPKNDLFIPSQKSEYEQEKSEIQSFRHLDKRSLTTATEQITFKSQKTESQAQSKSKDKASCLQEVQNLKKYLQRINESSLFTKNPTSHERISNPHQIIPINEKIQKPQKETIDIQNQNDKKEDVPNQSQDIHFHTHQNNLPVHSNLDNDTPIKQLKQKQYFIPINQLQPKDTLQKTILKPKYEEQQKQEKVSKSRNFVKSLQLLQDLIPNLPPQFMTVYEKIYTQVYQQQLKYQQKLERQQFLMNFMQQFLKGQRQKINCQQYLIHEVQANTKDQTQKQSDQQHQQILQILINKHLILCLVRQLASKVQR